MPGVQGAFPGIICDEIRIGNMGSGHCIIMLFVVETVSNVLNQGGLSRLLVKLEEMDLALCSMGIDMKYLYGVLTDGGSQWNVIRRRNVHRNLAKDTLNDPLLNQRYAEFDIETVLKEGDGTKDSKFQQICASLAQERWKLFKRRFDFAADDGVFLRKKALYDGYVMECDASSSPKHLQNLSSMLHGLIYEQRQQFATAFQRAMRSKPELNRPAIDPYHDVNKEQRRKQFEEYLSF